jgi:hypothetical protein
VKDDDDGLPPLRPTGKSGKPKALRLTRLTKDDLRCEALLYPERNYWRPRRRSDCDNVQRPCPYVACRHNLYLEEGQTPESIIFNFPEQEPWQVKTSCVLDLVEQHPEGLTLEQVGRVLGVTRERVRQIEKSGVKRAVRRADPSIAEELVEFFRMQSQAGDAWDEI